MSLMNHSPAFLTYCFQIKNRNRPISEKLACQKFVAMVAQTQFTQLFSYLPYQNTKLFPDKFRKPQRVVSFRLCLQTQSQGLRLYLYSLRKFYLDRVFVSF